MITQRIQRVLASDYVADLPHRSVEELRAMKTECVALENAVSYYRRLAQGRGEILAAEQARRARGGTVEELIADLPKILAGGGGRPSAVNARFSDPAAAIVELSFSEANQRLIDGDALAQLPNLGDDDLIDALDALDRFERELSSTRHMLHGVIDQLERELATRQQAAGTVG